MDAVRASLDDLIPFVIAVVWIIAQVAGAAAKKKRPSPPRPTEPRARPDDPFAELLRQLGGVEEFKSPEPEPVEEAPVKPVASRQHQIVKEVPPPKKPFQPLEKPTAVLKTPETRIDVRPKMSAFRSSIASIKLPTMPSMSLRVDTPSYAEASRGKQGIGSELHIKDRKALRRAMLSHIIFSPPKALESQANKPI